MDPSHAFDRVEAGRALGHDLYRRSDGAAASSWPASVREGFDAARAGGAPRKPTDRFVRKWLQLRLSALERDRVIDDDVTPELLRRIDVDRCPATRVVLTHGRLTGSDWSVDRLNNDGGYAANNLAIMSTDANRAKGTRSYEQAFALSQRAGQTDGLAPVEWLRLAALMLGPCFAERPALAPAIPLAAPMPNRTLRPAVQQIQHVFTQTARQQSGKNALIKQFGRAARNERSLIRLRVFAERLHQGLKTVDEPHDVWLQSGVMEAFVEWRRTLDESSWALAGEVSRCMAGSRIVPPGRLASWQLATGGYRL